MKLLLIDGHFGFFSMLLNTLREQQPDYLAVAFDVGKTFRHQDYADYKGTRERMPDDLRQQVERIQEVVQALNIPIFTRDGYEADDVLGTLARQAEARGVETMIVTGDRDIVQVVSDKTSVLTSGRKFSDTIVYTPETVQERWGLAPKQLIDLKALLGDTSDNVPGVKGVGEKGATDLIQTYGSVEAVYDNLEQVTARRTRTALEAGRDSAFLSKHLVTIITDVPGVALDLDACRVRDYDQDQVVELFRELEFRTLVDRLPPSTRAKPSVEAGPGGQLALFGEEAPAASAVEQEPSPYAIIDSEAALVGLLQTLQTAQLIAFDTETTSTDAQQADLVGIALAWGEGLSAYVPVGHQLPTVNGQLSMANESSPAQLPLERVIGALKPVLESGGIEKTAHNAEYDLTMLRRYGIDVAGPLFDTMIAQFLIDPGSRGLGLKNVAWQRLGVEMTPISDLIGTGKKQTTMDFVPIPVAGRYAAADTDMTASCWTCPSCSRCPRTCAAGCWRSSRRSSSWWATTSTSTLLSSFPTCSLARWACRRRG